MCSGDDVSEPGVPVVHTMRAWGALTHTFVRNTIVGLPPARTAAVVWESRGSVPGFDGRVTVLGDVPEGRHQRRRRQLRLEWAARLARPSIVHQHFNYRSLIGWRVANERRVPFVVSPFGHDVLVERKPEDMRQLLRADRCLALSPWLADRLAELGVERDRIDVYSPGIDLDRFSYVPRHPDEDRPARMLFLGRYVEKKGGLDLLRALAELGMPPAELDVRLVGGGEDEERWRGLARELQLDVSFLSGDDQDEVLGHLGWADVVVTPSRTGADGDAETLCYVNVEAQARGVPVVTTDHGGIPHGVQEDISMIVPEGDVSALAAGLERVLGDRGDWERRSRAGRRHVEERFDRRRQGRRLDELYRSVIAAR